MKNHYCGALLYTWYKNNIYIVLKKNKNEWVPFFGTQKEKETFEETAVRELFEETCGGLDVKSNDINLECNYIYKKKENNHYHIGLVYTSESIISDLSKNKLRKNIYNSLKMIYMKNEIKMFALDNIFKYKFHPITQTPILFYKTYLTDLQSELRNVNHKKNKIKHIFYNNNMFKVSVKNSL
jgi:ADP-ribose pyrophosphatase YjhB (NUDIX family)